MSDIRKWRFTTGYGATSLLQNLSTSFWGEWGATGEPANLTYTIRAQYELSDQSVDALERRALFEKRLKAIAKYQGRQGLLEIDFGAAGSRPETLTDVVLESFSPGQADNNLILEADLVFRFPMPGTLLRTLSAIKITPPPPVPADYSPTTVYYVGNTVRYLGQTYRCLFGPSVGYPPNTEPLGVVWELVADSNKGAWSVDALYVTGDVVTYNDVIWKAKQANHGQIPANNAIWGVNGVSVGAIDNTWFIVDYERQDRTLFKTVARGADIRVRSSPAMQTVTLTGIRQKVTALADTELSRRQASEAKMKAWVDLKGEEMAVTIDGVAQGAMHLSDVKKNNIDLPDAVAFDLVFFKGYVNG